MAERFPRPLREQEADALNHLLSAAFAGREALSEQDKTVEVVGRWVDEPTVELRVSAPPAPRAVIENNPPVEASTLDGLYTVILFVKDRLLNLLELVDNAGKGMLAELPAPQDLGPPDALGPTAARAWWQRNPPDSEGR